jgi:hypothetical protein
MITPIVSSSIRPNNPLLDISQVSFHQYIWVPITKIAAWIWNTVVLAANYLLDRISFLFHAYHQQSHLHILVQKVTNFLISIYYKIQSAIYNIPVILKHYAIFHTVETYIPPALKILVNSSYCYIRDLIAEWTTTNLKSEISQLKRENESLKNRNEQILKEIDLLTKSRDTFLKMGHIDRDQMKALDAEIETLRKRLSLSKQQIKSSNEQEQILEKIIKSLQEQKKLLEIHIKNLNNFYQTSGIPPSDEEVENFLESILPSTPEELDIEAIFPLTEEEKTIYSQIFRSIS